MVIYTICKSRKKKEKTLQNNICYRKIIKISKIIIIEKNKCLLNIIIKLVLLLLIYIYI